MNNNSSDNTEVPTLTILRGLPSSGKSTWAKIRTQRTRAAIINKEKLKALFFTVSTQKQTCPQKMQGVLEGTALALLKNGYNVIVDDHHIALEEIQRWCKAIEPICDDIKLEIVDFDITPEEAIRRDRGRKSWDDEPVGAEVINEFAKHLVDDKLPDVSGFIDTNKDKVHIIFA